MENLENEKLAYAKARAQQASAVAGEARADQCKVEGTFQPGRGVRVAFESPSAVLEGLRTRIQATNIDSQRLHHAADILERHPEFVEFAWLLSSGLV